MMEAKDTVLSNKKIQLLGQQYEDEVPTYDLNHYLLLAQAEISFKVGEDRGYTHARQHCEDVIIPQAAAQARREVAEWIKRNDFYNGTDPVGICIENPMWQAKLKEWGL